MAKKPRSQDVDSLMAQVRELSRLLGIRQRDLATLLGMKPSQLNLYYRGKVEMRTGPLMRTLEVLGIDLRAILQERLESLGAGGDARDADSRLMARLARLNAVKRKSLLRIIETLGA